MKKNKFVCKGRGELATILATHFFQVEVLEENEQRFCSECGTAMHEGFYFESDGTQYCSQDCLEQIISWERVFSNL